MEVQWRPVILLIIMCPVSFSSSLRTPEITSDFIRGNDVISSDVSEMPSIRARAQSDVFLSVISATRRQRRSNGQSNSTSESNKTTSTTPSATVSQSTQAMTTNLLIILLVSAGSLCLIVGFIGVIVCIIRYKHQETKIDRANKHKEQKTSTLVLQNGIEAEVQQSAQSYGAEVQQSAQSYGAEVQQSAQSPLDHFAFWKKTETDACSKNKPGQQNKTNGGLAYRKWEPASIKQELPSQVVNNLTKQRPDKTVIKHVNPKQKLLSPNEAHRTFSTKFKERIAIKPAKSKYVISAREITGQQDQTISQSTTPDTSFSDKKQETVVHKSPLAGRVIGINGLVHHSHDKSDLDEATATSPTSSNDRSFSRDGSQCLEDLHISIVLLTVQSSALKQELPRPFFQGDVPNNNDILFREKERNDDDNERSNQSAVYVQLYDVTSSEDTSPVPNGVPAITADNCSGKINNGPVSQEVNNTYINLYSNSLNDSPDYANICALESDALKYYSSTESSQDNNSFFPHCIDGKDAEITATSQCTRQSQDYSFVHEFLNLENRAGRALTPVKDLLQHQSYNPNYYNTPLLVSEPDYVNQSDLTTT